MKKFTEFKTKPKMVRESSELLSAQPPEEVANQSTSAPAKFFSKLFESREMAHVYHLTVKGEQGSFAAHKALGEYYEAILGIIDDLIETYSGQYGIIEEYDAIDTKETKTKDKLEYFEQLAVWVREEKKCFSAEDTHLHNMIDEATALIYKTIYKLKYNK